jgi:hypothetical protein
MVTNLDQLNQMASSSSTSDRSVRLSKEGLSRLRSCIVDTRMVGCNDESHLRGASLIEPFLSSLHGLHSLVYHSNGGLNQTIIVPPSSLLTTLEVGNVAIELKDAFTLPPSLTSLNGFNLRYIKTTPDNGNDADETQSSFDERPSLISSTTSATTISEPLKSVLPPSLTSISLMGGWNEVRRALAQPNGLSELRLLSLVRGDDYWSPPIQLLQYGHASLIALEELIISCDYVNHIHRFLMALGPRLRRMCIPIGSLAVNNDDEGGNDENKAGANTEKWSVKVNQWPLLERLHLTHLNRPNASCIGMWGERVAHAHPNLHILVIDASRSLGDSAHICNHLIRSWPNNKDVTTSSSSSSSSSSSMAKANVPSSVPRIIIFTEHYVRVEGVRTPVPPVLSWLVDTTNNRPSTGLKDDIYTVICAAGSMSSLHNGGDIILPPHSPSNASSIGDELSAPYLHHLVNPPAIDYDNRFIWCAKTHIQNHDGIRTLLANNRWVIVKPAEFVPYSFVTSDPLPLLLDLASVMNNSSIPPASCPINHPSSTSTTTTTVTTTTTTTSTGLVTTTTRSITTTPKPSQDNNTCICGVSSLHLLKTRHPRPHRRYDDDCDYGMHLFVVSHTYSLEFTNVFSCQFAMSVARS